VLVAALIAAALGIAVVWHLVRRKRDIHEIEVGPWFTDGDARIQRITFRSPKPRQKRKAKK
jgi:hypothetical protein